ncbi:MAG: shikimate kinase [Spirochaetes bacterium]|nr:shikimate kinase [Spirochaetota bacterium]
MNRIYLIGFMGAGKSTTGALLADMLGLPFIDTDAVIENEERSSIPRIFSERGEPYFRKLEHRVLRRLTRIHRGFGFVMATGGGMPASGRNIAYMRRHGIVVYLEAPVSTLLSRIRDAASRPVYSSLKEEDRHGKEEAVKTLLLTRAPFYRKAHITVQSANDSNAAQTARRIEKILRE